MQAGSTRASPSLLYRLRSFQFHSVRRLLLAWIRPTILGCDAKTLCLNEGDAVCYVLPFRSIADLMVVDQACQDAGLPRPYLPMADELEQRAFFFLGRPEGRFGRKSLRRQSARMIRLFEKQEGRTAPIKVVPVSLFWGHQPDQEKSWFKLLLSENWSVTSRFRKLLAIIFHPHHILVEFSPPVELSELAREHEDPERRIRKLMRLLRVHFNRQKQAILGPDLSHRRTLINSIMSGIPVRQAIEREAASDKTTHAKVEKKALAYANEIVSDQSYRVVRFFHVLLTWLWNKLYDGIDVYNVERVKELARSHEIVYTPCHRSHIDYLLLSYVLYHNGLTPPHIAAGRNLNLPIAGPLLRRAGAFFMRRSFKGDALYKAIFDEYLHLMFVRGYSVEYFIEGGRSRTGRMLTPRTGMLSMTMRSFERDASRPMALMPVYFSYERVIEAPTYFGELAGKDKKEESIFDLFKIFQVFKAAFGKVAVSFGEPVIMSDFLDKELPDWRTHGQAGAAAFSDACVVLAHQLATNINTAATLNPVNLVATALLCTPRQTMEETRLLSQVQALKQIAAGAGGTIVTPLSAAEIVAESEAVAGVLRVRQPFGDIITAPPDVTILLTYYRNNTAHVFALPSLIARIVRTCDSVTVDRIVDICRTLYPYLKAEFFLRWEESEVPDHCRSIIELLVGLELLQVVNDQVAYPDPAREQFACLSELAEIIEPTLERFFIVATLLAARGDATIRDIESAAATIGQRLSTIYGINSPEFFDRSLFSTFIARLRATQVLSTSGNRIVVSDAFAPIREAAATTLDPDVRFNVLHVAGKLESHTT